MREINDFYESIGAAIESAAASLPEGCMVQIEIENGGYSVSLVGNIEKEFFEGESIVDDIECAIAYALEQTR